MHQQEPKRNIALGLVGVLGIWITAGAALPFVNVLKVFTPEQLMVFRGLIPAFIVLLFYGRTVLTRDKFAVWIAFVLPFATLGLFEGIRHWGAGPTIIVVTTTPVLNILFGIFTGRRISLPCVAGLSLVLGGVCLACWHGQFQWTGFLWSVFGTIMNAILYELFAKTKAQSHQKFFWLSVGMGLLGLSLDLNDPNTTWSAIAEPHNIWLLIGFAFVGGFLYWISNLITFKNLPTNEASVLAQGETPAVILGSYWILHEELSRIQMIGVAIALLGAVLLGKWLTEKPKPEAVLE